MDPESKKIVLTMQRGLVAGLLPPDFPAMGQVFAEATVLRIDPGLGLLCSLPSAAGQVTYPPGFAHISNTSEGRVKSLEKVGIWDLVGLLAGHLSGLPLLDVVVGFPRSGRPG